MMVYVRNKTDIMLIFFADYLALKWTVNIHKNILVAS